MSVSKRYRIEQELSTLRGGQGQIFEAFDNQFDRQVLVKKLSADAAAGGGLSRFQREARVTAQLQHPGIVPVYDYFEDADHVPCCVMEYVFQGGANDARLASTLDDLIKNNADMKPHRGDETFRRLVDALSRVAETVAYAHARGFVHRDLKCSNILITETRVVVLDWGIVKLPNSPETDSTHGSYSNEDVTQAGENVGTKYYMSPEQLRDPTQVDERSDVYSLGVILYRILTGQHPSECSRDTLPPRRLVPKISKALEAICLKAMDPDPNCRYSSATLFGQDLTNWLSDRRTLAYSSGLDDVWRLARGYQTLVTTLIALVLASLLSLVVLFSALTRKTSQLDASAATTELQRDELFETVDDFFTQTSAWLKDQPGATKLRRNLLKSAKQHFDKIAQLSPPDKAGRVFQATASYRLSQISHQMLDREASAQIGKEALARFRQLSAEYPDDDEFRFDVFHCLHLLRRRNEALDTIETLCQTNPQPHYRDAYAAALCDTARQEMNSDLSRSRQLAERGLGVAKDLAAEHPDRPDYRRHIATSAMILAEISFHNDQFGDAMEFSSAAMREYERLLEDKPQEIGFVVDAVYSSLQAIRCAVGAQDLDRARSICDFAAETSRACLEKDPRDFRRWQLLFFSLRERIDQELYDASEFDELLQQYRDDLEFALRSWPKHWLLRILLAEVHSDPRFGDFQDLPTARRLIHGLDVEKCDVSALIIKATVQLRLGDLESADSYVRKCGDTNEADLILALIHAHQGEFEAAEKLLKQYRGPRCLASFERTEREIVHLKKLHLR